MGEINFDKTIKLQMPIEFLPKQMAVLDAIKRNEGVLYSGAFRAGKTLLLVHAAVMTCLKYPNIRGMLVSQVASQLKGVVFDLLIDELDKYQKQIDDKGIGLKLAPRVTRSMGNMSVTFYNGSKILFRSCKTREEQRKLAGYTLDFYGLDEPVDMDEYVFNQLSGRISGTGNLKNCFGILTTNPESETHWLYKHFYLDDNPNFVHFDTTTYDNVLLPDYENYIKKQERKWDEDWVRRYLNGQWGMFEGQIFKLYNPKKHLFDSNDLKKEDIKYTICGVDWGLVDPHCILIGAVTKNDKLRIIREYYGRKKSTHELSKKLASLYEEYRFKKVYCDPTAADLILQAWERGVPIGKKTKTGISSYANNDVAFGIARLNSFFKHNVIKFDYNCTNLKREIPAYRYKEGTETPMKKRDHSCDALRYLITDFNPYRKDSGFDALWYKFNKWG